MVMNLVPTKVPSTFFSFIERGDAVWFAFLLIALLAYVFPHLAVFLFGPALIFSAGMMLIERFFIHDGVSIINALWPLLVCALGVAMMLFGRWRIEKTKETWAFFTH